jgi:two-component system sensor histidine kinase BaeS
MWSRRHRRRPPPWWPANEPWPPANPREAWRHGRARFVRRLALMFAVLLFLSAVGVGSLVSMLTGRAVGATSTNVSPVAAAAVLAIVLFGLLLAIVRSLGVPLGRIVEAANRIAEGDFSTRVPELGPRSVRTVGKAFNTMAARLESQGRLRRHLMADVAHELRTPLSVIQARIEGLLDGVYPRDDARLEQLLEDARLLTRLVDDLQMLATVESGMLTLQKEPTDVAALLQDVIDMFSDEARQSQVAVRLEAQADLPLLPVDPLRIREVTANLLSNALHHTPAGGEVVVEARKSDGRMEVSVADTGTGIAADDLSKIFDRFYKGRGSKGSGLGLTIARQLVTMHGGEIRAESRAGGTTITVSLPASLAAKS